MRLALDTSAVIDLIRGRRPEHRARLDQARRDGYEIRLSTICLHELLYGARRSRRPEHHLGIVESLMADLTVDDWTPEDALIAARLRCNLEAAGRPIGPMDTLIAAHAIRTDAILVTGNVRHFVWVGSTADDLRLMDWSISDQPLDRPALLATLRRPQED